MKLGLSLLTVSKILIICPDFALGSNDMNPLIAFISSFGPSRRSRRNRRSASESDSDEISKSSSNSHSGISEKPCITSESAESSSGDPEAKRTIDDLKLKLEHGKRRISALTGHRVAKFSLSGSRKYDSMMRESLISYIEESRLYPHSLTDVEKAAIFGMSPDAFIEHLEEKYNTNKNIRHLDAYRRGAKKYTDMLRKSEQEDEKSKAREKVEFYQDKLRKCGGITRYYKEIIHYFPLYVILGEASVSALCASYDANAKELKEKEDEYKEKYAGLSEEIYYSLPSEEEKADGGSQGGSCKEGECSVCLTRIYDDDPIVGCLSNVPHRFHANCALKSWEKKKNSCPGCRGKFTEEKGRKLRRWVEKLKAKAGEAAMKKASRLVHKPAFDSRYVINGMPVKRRSREAIKLLKTARKGITKAFEEAKKSPLLSLPSKEFEFSIPENVVAYFLEGTQMKKPGYRDPRSIGFVEHQAAVIQHIKWYLGRGMKLQGVTSLFYAILDAFYMKDCALEYLSMDLYYILDPAERIEKIRESPSRYSALSSLIRGRRYHKSTFSNIQALTAETAKAIRDSHRRSLKLWLEGF